MSTDDRAKLYADLHGRQMSQEEQLNRNSAQQMLGMLFEHARPSSILDVGCGLGTWLKVAQEMGVKDVRGVEGSWLDRDKCAIDSALIDLIDLEHPFSLNRRFDLAICLEVAEHLTHEASEGFVSSLAAHADLVMFSAAIPLQGGHHHVNEQFLDYWNERFKLHGFRWIDLFRPTCWRDMNVLWWLRQNTVLFAHPRAIGANAKLQEAERRNGILSVVHPEVFISRVLRLQRAFDEHQALMKQLLQGGKFEVEPGADKTLKITKL